MLRRYLTALVMFSFSINAWTNENQAQLLNMETIGPKTEAVDPVDYQQVYYVSVSTGSDRSGDGSKTKSWKTLPHALAESDRATPEHPYAILVSEGVYSQWTLEMKENVDLFGGYCPETWERDIFEHRTVLDGECVRRVVLGADRARIDGFVITHGLARYHGGGILCNDASPVITNNFVIDNMVLEQEDFDHSHMYQDGHHGGGIAVLYNSVPVIKNNVIAGNKTSVGVGGGIAFYGLFRVDGVEEPEIKDNFLVGGVQAVCENNVIVGNTTGVNDLNRNRSSSGGGIACAYEARPFIRNNVVAMNRAKGRSDAGGIYIEFFSYPVIEGNWIVGNVSDDDGGAIYTMRLGQPLIRRNIIAGNWTAGGGSGGVRLSKEGRACILDNVIVRNPTGSGVQCIDSYMELVGNIIMDNPQGPGLSYWSYFSYFPASVVRSNVIRNNGEMPIRVRWNNGPSLLVEQNNIEGGYEGEGNLDSEPGFADDGMTGSVVSVEFDSIHYTTTIVPEKSIMEKNHRLTGRVLRLGERWSVIREAWDKGIKIWGDLSSEIDIDQRFEIMPSYRKQ